MARKASVRWTDAELDQLAEAVAVMRQNDVVSQFHRLVMRAQEQLPEDRRRPINTHQTVSGIVERVKHLLHLQREKSRVTAAASEPKTVVKLQDPQVVLDSLDNARILTEACARFVTMQQNIFAALQDVQLSVARMQSQLHPHTNGHHANGAARRPRILVIGLLPEQENIISSRFDQRAQLKFASTQSGSHQLPDADLYIAMTKFMSHGWQTQIPDRAKSVLCHGGLTQLSTHIESFLS